MAKRKVLVALDESLVDRLDRVARERGLTRSALIASLAERQLDARTPEQQRGIERAHRRLRALARANGTSGEDTTTLVRRMRDERTAQLGDRAGRR